MSFAFHDDSKIKVPLPNAIIKISANTEGEINENTCLSTGRLEYFIEAVGNKPLVFDKKALSQKAHVINAHFSQKSTCFKAMLHLISL